MSDEEQVICVPTRLARHFVRPGLNRGPLNTVLEFAGHDFRPRSEAESDESTLHLATYAVLTCNGMVFTYRRGKSGGESRLHGRRSLGVGGHVTEDDFRYDTPDSRDVIGAVHRAVRREVDEEVVWDGPIATVRLGLIYDDSDAVSRVHLGVAYQYELADTSATAREDCLADARWERIEDVKADSQVYESWSKIILEAL